MLILEDDDARPDNSPRPAVRHRLIDDGDWPAG
jgi:hypothetical protein